MVLTNLNFIRQVRSNPVALIR